MTACPTLTRAARCDCAARCRGRWASALVDDVAAEPAVVAAVALLRDAVRLADDVDFALGEAEAAELGWYAVQELPFI